MAVKKSRRVAPKLKTLDAYLGSPPEQSMATVGIDLIRLPVTQPRRYFDPEKLAQLVQSVKEHGILEPLLVRPVDGGYELVAGERRLRAAREVGLTEVPIVAHSLDDKQALQVALMENLQREDLNPVEETEAVLELLAMTLEVDKNEVVSILHQSYNAKQRGLQLNQNVLIQLEKIESLLSEIGRFNAGTFRSSRLPLLNLPDEVLSALRRGAIEYTKAAVIARVKEPSLRESLLEEAIADSLSLSEIKERVKAAVEPPTEPPALVKRMETIYKLTKKQKLWDDPKKCRKFETLLAKIEELISFDGLDESPPKEEVEATQDEPPLTSDSLQDSSPLELEKDPLESREDVTVAISSESSLPPPEMAEKPFDPETPSSELSDKSKPLAKEEPTSGSREVTESLTDAEMASRLGVKTSTLGKAKKRTDFSEWSQSKDSQAIAWQWVTESKHFVPLKN